MNTLKITLIGLLVAVAMVISVALVIRSLPDGERPSPSAKETAQAPEPAAPAVPEPAPEPTPVPSADQDRIPQAEGRTGEAGDRIPHAAEQPEPQQSEPPLPHSTMQGRATELLAIPPAGILGAPSAQPADPASPAAVTANGRLAFSPAQEERVRYVLMSHNVMQTEAPDFPLQLGATVPDNVPLSPLPIELAEIVPDYRAYAYVISQNRIVIIAADRRTIGALIPIEARS